LQYKSFGGKMIEYPSNDGIYDCVACNHVECGNSRVYNTPVTTEIKRKFIHQDLQFG
jgi:hypothetical protein